MKKIIAVIAAMIFAILPVKAAYQYKVTFMAGLHGTSKGVIQEFYVDNGTEITLPGLPEGEGIYTAKGWHVSGKEQIWVSGNYPVNADTVFVASYGVSGDMLSYTVRYLDQVGNTLEAAETFHAKKGDKPVVAYRYIENYTPVETKAFTFTVEYDGRVIDFIYRRVEQNQQEQGEGEVIEEVIVQPAEPVNPNPNPNPNPAPAGPDDQTVNPDNPAGPDNPAVNPDDQNGENIDDNETPQGQPEEIIDLDDADTPLAPPDENIDDDKTPEGKPDGKPGGNGGSESANNAALVGGIAGGSLLLLLLLFLFRRRKNNTEQ